MGFMDKIKGMFGGGIKPKVEKVVAGAKSQVVDRVIAVAKGKAEREVKILIADIAGEIINDQIDSILGVSLPGAIRQRVVQRAVDRVVVEVWELVKDQL